MRPLCARHVGARDHVDDPTALHDVVTVGESCAKRKFCSTSNDRVALLLHQLDGAADLLHDAPARDPRSARRAGTARRRCAARARSPASAARRPTAACPGCGGARAEFGKQLEDVVERHAAVADAGRQQQIFRDVEARVDAALFRHIADAEPGDASRAAAAIDLLRPGDADRAGPLVEQAHDGAQRRGLAGAVAADDGDAPRPSPRRARRRAARGNRRRARAGSCDCASGPGCQS